MNNLINENLVVLDFEADTKEAVLKKVAGLMHDERKLKCKMQMLDLKECQQCEVCAEEDYLQSLVDRENIFPTSVGFLFGIPHGKCCSVIGASVAFIRLKNPILWSDEEEEKEEAKFIFAIAVTKEEGKNEHIEILTKLSRAILDDEFREKLEKAETKNEILNLISEKTN